MPDKVLLMVATVKGIFFYESDKKRKKWKMTPTLPGWEAYSVLGEDGGKRIYAGTSHYSFGTTIRVTTNMGKTWKQLEGRPEYPKETGWELKRIWQLVPGHASDNGSIFAGVDVAGLFVSRDKGKTWTELSALTRDPSRAKWFPGNGGLCLHTILIDPKDKNRIWVGISAVGVFRTTDGGQSWTPCNKGLPGLPTGSDDPAAMYCIHKMVLDPKNSDTLYMQFHGGVMKSTDGADSWKKIENGLPGNFGFPMVITKDGDLFVVPLKDENRAMFDGKFRVYRSTNGGKKWQPLSKGLPDDPQFVGVLRDAMAVDSMDTPGVYVGTTMGEVYASNDTGDSWSRLPGTLPRITNIKTCLI
ncbi:MAG TPA: hypothetical protein VH518_23380 [Tepidisphaeraceae bacterium]|jgi:photosystem II stability/assembly factor-like uncharacterized protein